MGEDTSVRGLCCIWNDEVGDDVLAKDIWCFGDGMGFDAVINCICEEGSRDVSDVNGV